MQHSEHRNQNTQQKDEIIQEKNKEIELIKCKLQQKDEIIEQKSKEIEQKEHENQEKDKIIQRKNKEMEQIVQEIESKENIIRQRDEEIEQKVQECQQKERKIEQKEKEIQRKNNLVEQKKVEIEHAHKQYQEIENQLRKLKLKQENSELKLMDTSLSTRNESQHAETQILESQSELQRKGTKTTEKEIEKEVQQMHQQDEREKVVKNQHLVNKSGQINNTANEKHLLNDRDAENETTKYKIKAANPIEKPMDQNKKQVDLLPSVEKCKIDYLSNYVIANNAVSPVVSLNNIHGKPIINCSDNITVKLQANKISGVITVPVDVAELGNGQYKVSFTIKEAGDYKLVMCVGNQCIVHPPFR